eukprot:1689400-Alexandrium_andersonii.AAC.1
MALYAASVTSIPKARAAKLASAILRVLFPRAARRRSRVLAQQLAQRSVPEPQMVVFTMRVMAFRRVWWKRPELRGKIQELLDCDHTG